MSHITQINFLLGMSTNKNLFVILTTDEICREYRASRSREAAYFLMRLCA
jgi:hypothetical protein